MDESYRHNIYHRKEAYRLWEERVRKQVECDELWGAANIKEAMRCQELVKALKLAEEEAWARIRTNES